MESGERLDQGLNWYHREDMWILTADRQTPAPNRVVLWDGQAMFWKRFPDGAHHWTDRVKCPYTDIQEAKVWAKREYLLNCAE